MAVEHVSALLKWNYTNSFDKSFFFYINLLVV